MISSRSRDVYTMTIDESHLEPEAEIKRLASRFCQNWGRVVLLVCGPTKTTQKEQLPLVSTHADVLDGTVDDLCFAYINVLDYSHHGIVDHCILHLWEG